MSYVRMYKSLYVGMMPFELHTWQGAWIVIGISFFLGMVAFFWRLPYHENHDHLSYLQRQMVIMNEKHDKEMQVMQENHEKELQVMYRQHEKHEREIEIMRQNHEKQMLVMHKQHEKQIQDMHERQLVIQKQMDLINAFTQGMHEVQRSTDRYIAGIREYSHLKEKDNSWLSSLSRQEKIHMYQLEELLGINEVIDVRMSIAIVIQNFEQVERFCSSQLEKLEDALDRMDIDKMKQLQKQINKKHLNAHLQEAAGQIKSEMISTSRALQKSGVLSRIASRFYQSLVAIISKFIE